MKHAKRLSLIDKNPRPRGFRKIVVDDYEYWWRCQCYDEPCVTILDSQTRKTIVCVHWYDESMINPKFISEIIKAYNKTDNKEKYDGYMDKELFYEIVELSKDEK